MTYIISGLQTRLWDEGIQIANNKQYNGNSDKKNLGYME